MTYSELKNYLRSRQYSESVYPDNTSMKEFSTPPDSKFGLSRYIFIYHYKINDKVTIMDKKIKSYYGFEFHYETEMKELTEAIQKEWKELISDIEQLKKGENK